MYDVIVVGAGHAGVEAIHTLKKQGLKCALVTFREDDISSLPCNVSIGGSAKGIVVNELHALGGLMPKAADNTQLQTKILNISKGPAVRALRAQVDKVKYPLWIKEHLKTMGVEIIEQEVVELKIHNDSVKGVIFANGEELISKKTIIATGTFLDSKIMLGIEDIKSSGPDNKKTNKTISKQLKELGHKIVKLKTGTPPRILKDTIDFSKLDEEPGSDNEVYFSEDKLVEKDFQNIPAWLAYTNEETHRIINENIEKSYLFADEIEGAGPRYCPSIEDKVKRFSDKNRHQLFLELESEELDTIYLSGFSSSMPIDVQNKMLRTIEGFENAIIHKPAYAIEYDSLDPQEITQSLESKKIKNLYFAGQINGTSGYEEAAAQGLMAAINASNSIKGKEEFILKRNESYIGVMIDDITTKGIQDPYRLLTSRAEYRLILRMDNAWRRLYKIGYEQKLLNEQEYISFKKREDAIELFKALALKTTLSKNDVSFVEYVEKNGIKLRQEGIRLNDFIKRPEVKFEDVWSLIPEEIKSKTNINENDLTTAVIEIKFSGYIERQEREIKNYLRIQKMKLSKEIDYNNIPNLAIEAKEKLQKFKPSSVHQASNISGINPADIMVLIQWVNKNEK